MDTERGRGVPRAMINRHEYGALVAAAKNIWSLGAPRDGAIVDAGSFVGASTLALAEGLSQSPLTESERVGRIWSYDLFRTIPAMARKAFKDDGLNVGDSFRHIYDETINPFSSYVRTFEGDILSSPKPTGPISILFLDILWNWETTIRLADDFYTRMPARRSLLIHQDFVYPFYPWIIISMGMLSSTFQFAKHIEASSVAFDVIGDYEPGALDQALSVPNEQALAYYDYFIDRLDGWASGSLRLGKVMYLASTGHCTAAKIAFDEVREEYGDLRRVAQYYDAVEGYLVRAKSGVAKPLGKVATTEANKNN